MLSTSYNSKSANFFAGCPEKGHVTELLVTEWLLHWKIHSQMCSVWWSLLQLLCYQIRQRGKKDTRRYSTSWEQAGLTDPAWVVLMLIPLETHWTCLLLQDAAWSCQDNPVPLPWPDQFIGMALISTDTVYRIESVPTLTLCSSRGHHTSFSGRHHTHERSTYLSSC